MALDGKIAALSPLKTRIFGAVLISLGIAATLVGMWEHRRVLAALTNDDYRYADRPAVARWMGLALVGVGLAALAVILLF
jgi:uncharacterized membrane protein YidH (DUF202 family)